MVIPSAFQTRAYAHAVLRGTLPKIEDRVLEDRVAARLIRQQLLTKANPPRLWALIDESGLRRQVGGRSVMQEQRERIIEMAGLPNIVMQVIPYEAGAHPAIDSTFTLLEFSDPHQRPLVFSEGLAGRVYLERPAEIERYREALEYLGSCALSVAASIELIESII